MANVSIRLDQQLVRADIGAQSKWSLSSQARYYIDTDDTTHGDVFRGNCTPKSACPRGTRQPALGTF